MRKKIKIKKNGISDKEYYSKIKLRNFYLFLFDLFF